MSTYPENSAPYISVVVAARNDNHGGNMIGRMQAFVDSWIGQARRHDLSSEIIVVEWNPPADRPRLRDALRPPQIAPVALIHAIRRDLLSLPRQPQIGGNNRERPFFFELLEDPRQVGLHRCLADVQVAGDLAVRRTAGNEVEYVQLAAGQRIGRSMAPAADTIQKPRGYRWSERLWNKDVKYGSAAGADIKIPWELGRMQHLTVLAYAAILSDSKNQAAKKDNPYFIFRIYIFYP